VTVGTNNVPFNKEATRWLGIWLDAQLSLKEHHATRMKEGRKAVTRLRRLTGQMGLTPANCRKVMTACVQSATMFGAELWWKGDYTTGTQGRAEEIQRLINQEARATMGCFRTTNLGALPMESGLRAATAQLENRQRPFGLRLLSLPLGDQAREVVGAPTGIGRRLTNTLAHGRPTESTVLLEEPETLDAELLQEEEAEAKAEAERTRPGLTMFTDGSRLDDGATGYSVVWKRGLTWAGAKCIWATTKRPMMQSAPLLPMHWSWQRKGAQPRNESPSFRMHRQPSGGWHRTNLAPGNSTPSRRGNTSPCCAGPGRASSSNPMVPSPQGSRWQREGR